MRLLALISTAADGSRDHYLDETVRLLREQKPDTDVEVAREWPLGLGWQQLLGRTGWQSYDLVWLLGDDAWLEPGAVNAALAAHEQGVIPAPRVLHPYTRRLQSCGAGWEQELEPGSRVPNLLTYLLTPAQVETLLPVPPMVLYLDYVLTRRLAGHGYHGIYTPGFCYRHMCIGGSHHDQDADETLARELGAIA